VTQSVCRSCGAVIFREGAGRPRKLCDVCRGGRYGGAHQKKRAAELEQQYGRPCARCGKPMERGQELHLDHRDGGGPSDYLGWSHAICNLRAASAQRDRNAAARVAAAPAAPRRREPPPCKFHDPPRHDCPHSRDW
jgi:hypothetical protein